MGAALRKRDTMTAVIEGCIVKVHFTGKTASGEVFDSTVEGEPLEFVVGSGKMIPGFEAAILGMEPQEEKEFALPPKAAYGERDESREQVVLRSDLPGDLVPRVGDIMAVEIGNERYAPVRIKRFDETTATLDLNHPLAGETLYLSVKVLEVSAPETREP
jgi:peptidylprolyl isomerase